MLRHSCGRRPRRKRLRWLLQVGSIELAQITRDALLDLSEPALHLRTREILVSGVDRFELIEPSVASDASPKGTCDSPGVLAASLKYLDHPLDGATFTPFDCTAIDGGRLRYVKTFSLRVDHNIYCSIGPRSRLGLHTVRQGRQMPGEYYLYNP